jgi:hypothetical protein
LLRQAFDKEAEISEEESYDEIEEEEEHEVRRWVQTCTYKGTPTWDHEIWTRITIGPMMHNNNIQRKI